MSEILAKLTDILEARKSAPADDSYVAQLYAQGLNKILEKVGEEATETILAAKDEDESALIKETADLWFHTLIMLSHMNLSAADVLEELERRFGLSGLEEKTSRNND